jgi:hypothetical protein
MLALDHRGPEPELGGTDGGDITARSGPDDYDVEFGVGHLGAPGFARAIQEDRQLKDHEGVKAIEIVVYWNRLFLHQTPDLGEFPLYIVQNRHDLI